MLSGKYEVFYGLSESGNETFTLKNHEEDCSVFPIADLLIGLLRKSYVVNISALS